MTREAINELKKYTLGKKNTEKAEISVLQLNRVIKALEQEPCDVFDEYGNYKYPSDVELTEPNMATSMPSEDAISRQAVLDLMADYDLSMGQVVKGIHALPSITPQEPKTGHWIIKDGKEQGYDIAGVKTWYIQIMCDKCGLIKTAIEGHTAQYNYCPNCGAKMESEVRE